MMDTDDCHRHAAECERLAEIANHPKIKQELRALAQEWRQMDVSELSKGVDGGSASRPKPLNDALVLVRGNLRHGGGEKVIIRSFGQHRCVRHLFVDALDGVAVRVSANKDNRGLAHRMKPSGDLNPFAASFEIDVHQDNIGLIAHCEDEG